MTLSIHETEAEAWDDSIRLLFEKLSGLPTYWADQPRDFVNPGDEGECTLDVISEATNGVDDRVTVYDATAPLNEECVPTIYGNRIVTLQVQVNTFAQDALRRARFFVARIVNRLRREDVNALLTEMNTSIATIGPVALVPFEVDSRAYSSASVEIVLNRSSVEQDEPHGYIATIGVLPQFTDNGGTVLPSDAFTITLPTPP